MGSHTVNEEEKKYTPSGEENRVIIAGMQIIQKQINKEWELESKGKLLREVNPKDYIKIKAYDNKDITKPKEPIKANKSET